MAEAESDGVMWEIDLSTENAVLSSGLKCICRSMVSPLMKQGAFCPAIDPSSDRMYL